MADLTPACPEYDFSAAIWDYLERVQHFRCETWGMGSPEPEVVLCACGEHVELPDGIPC